MIQHLPKFLLLIILFTAFGAAGQNRKKLEKKRKSLLNNINKTSNLIKTTKKTKAAALEKYMLLKGQVQSRAAVIATLRKEVTLAQNDIEQNQGIVTALNEDVKVLKQRYVKMVRKAYRYQNANRRLLFLFSANSFNDMMRRWQYLRQYHRFRKEQVQLISQLQQSLTKKTTTLKERINEKETLLKTAEEQKQTLGKAMKDKDKQLKSLSTKEKELEKQLQKQKTEKEGLNDAIQVAIQRSFRSSRKNARTLKGLAKRKLTKKETKIAKGFKNQRGKLTKPVFGKITGKFGTHPHPTYKRLKIKNDGVDITTKKNATAKAVYDGKVINVLFVPGYQNAVMIQHGDYYTVYSRLATTFVKKGAYIRKGQRIGKVGTKSGKTILHFQIWKNDVRLNPQRWLRK